MHQDHLTFLGSVTEICGMVRAIVVAKIGRECDRVDMFTCIFIEETDKASAKAFGLPDPPEGLWARWKAMLAATAEVAPDE